MSTSALMNHFKKMKAWLLLSPLHNYSSILCNAAAGIGGGCGTVITNVQCNRPHCLLISSFMTSRWPFSRALTDYHKPHPPNDLGS